MHEMHRLCLVGGPLDSDWDNYVNKLQYLPLRFRLPLCRPYLEEQVH